MRSILTVAFMLLLAGVFCLLQSQQAYEAALFGRRAGGGIGINSVVFGTPWQYDLNRYPTHTVNADSWPNTWAADGKIYAFGNDTANGAFWDNTAPSSNMGLGILSDFNSSDIIGSSANSMAAWGTYAQTGSDGATFKCDGIISISGVLYALTYRLQTITGPPVSYSLNNGQLIKSSDTGTPRGQTWTPAPPSTAQPYASPMFPGQVFPFAWVQYGQDYGGIHPNDNSNLYAYAMVKNWPQNTNAIYMGRVALANIANLSASDWTYYQGGDGMVSGNWGSSSTAVNIINAVPGYAGQGHGAQYLPMFKQFIYFGETVANTITVYTAPNPWGPYNLIYTYNEAGRVFYYLTVMPISVSVDGGHSIVITATDQSGAGNPVTYVDQHTGTYTLWLIPVMLN